MMDSLSEKFTKNITGAFGEAGVEWLKQLPTILTECAQRWSLTVKPHFSNLSYNYVAPVVQANGTEAILKVCVPSPEWHTEYNALCLYAGRGICRLLQADAAQGILLLESLKPGLMLASVTDDEQATSIAAQVMRRLWRPAPANHNFPTVATWSQGLDRLRETFAGGTGPFPVKLVEEAEHLFAELIPAMGEPTLLHGDLHHYNILTAERESWLAIDPKGVVGEPAYETGALLRNPFGIEKRPDLVQFTTRRIDQLATELNLERARIRGWNVAQAVLSVWWDYEDGGDSWQEGIRFAEQMAAVKE
ncbi:MAG: phosphotransferase [Chloroflexi bacterium]|nr:phosphotransferase [Chloroflexota bacterium]